MTLQKQNDMMRAAFEAAEIAYHLKAHRLDTVFTEEEKAYLLRRAPAGYGDYFTCEERWQGWQWGVAYALSTLPAPGEDERARFESLILSHPHALDTDADKRSDGTYLNASTGLAWWIWQARAEDERSKQREAAYKKVLAMPDTEMGNLIGPPHFDPSHLPNVQCDKCKSFNALHMTVCGWCQAALPASATEPPAKPGEDELPQLPACDASYSGGRFYSEQTMREYALRARAALPTKPGCAAKFTQKDMENFAMHSVDAYDLQVASAAVPSLPNTTEITTDEILTLWENCNRANTNGFALKFARALLSRTPNEDAGIGFSMYFVLEDWAIIYDGVMLEIANSEKRKAANSESTSDIRAAEGKSILKRLHSAMSHGSAKPASAPVFAHPDDTAIDRFAVILKAKMADSRAKGRNGWDNEVLCPSGKLPQMLRDHVAKGDPRDVGVLAMMCWARGESTSSAPPAGEVASVNTMEGFTDHLRWIRKDWGRKEPTDVPLLNFIKAIDAHCAKLVAAAREDSYKKGIRTVCDRRPWPDLRKAERKIAELEAALSARADDTEELAIHLAAEPQKLMVLEDMVAKLTAENAKLQEALAARAEPQGDKP